MLFPHETPISISVAGTKLTQTTSVAGEMAQWVVVGTGQAGGPESKPPGPHKTLGLAVISDTGSGDEWWAWGSVRDSIFQGIRWR